MVFDGNQKNFIKKRGKEEIPSIQPPLHPPWDSLWHIFVVYYYWALGVRRKGRGGSFCKQVSLATLPLQILANICYVVIAKIIFVYKNHLCCY
jgi:hypothetical protein